MGHRTLETFRKVVNLLLGEANILETPKLDLTLQTGMRRRGGEKKKVKF